MKYSKCTANPSVDLIRMDPQRGDDRILNDEIIALRVLMRVVRDVVSHVSTTMDSRDALATAIRTIRGVCRVAMPNEDTMCMGDGCCDCTEREWVEVDATGTPLKEEDLK